MGIDGIGKGGAPPPANGIDRTTSPSAPAVGSSTEFKVGHTSSVEAPPSASLDQVRSGAISVAQYLDLKVNESTAHLVHRLNAEQLSFIRQNLREQLSADPALVDLVKAATGKLPPPNE